MKKRALVTLMAAVVTMGSVLAMPIQAEAASWKKNSVGWWWQEDNNSWPVNQWKKINGSWYYFDGRGYMVTGWQKIGGSWYYLQPSGAMLGGGWHWIGNKCYYMNGSGVMAENTWIGNDYVDGSGAWVPGKTKSAAKAQWIQSGNRWWYRHTDGGYTKNGWEKIGDQWYLFDGAGWMLTGWQKVGGSWYYLQPSGAMAANTWIGQYYVDGSGAWIVGKTQGSSSSTSTTVAQNHWIQSGSRWWYRHADGGYTKNGWELIDGKWYHFDASGWMDTNKWIGNYYVTSDGAMATNTWIGSYYVGADGVWIPNYHTHNWEEQSYTIQHEAVTQLEWVVDKEAWTEELPVYTNEEHEICNGCGEDLTGWTGEEREQHFIDNITNPGCGGFHSEFYPVQTGTQTVNHDAEGHYETVVITPAWTETKVTGYVCNVCGNWK